MKLKDKMAKDWADENCPKGGYPLGHGPAVVAFAAGFEAAREMIARNNYAWAETKGDEVRALAVLEMGEEEE